MKKRTFKERGDYYKGRLIRAEAAKFLPYIDV